MLAHSLNPASVPDQSIVLAKALTRAADRLGVSRGTLARILGVSAPTVTRLYAGQYQLDPRRKEWELGLLFVRLFRSLDSVVGDDATARAWLASDNLALNDSPAALITSTEGLVRVIQYLDASRAVI